MKQHVAGAIDRNRCTGCGACAQVCVFDAISLEPNQSGFTHPIVTESDCVECGQCIAVCPVGSSASDRVLPLEVYAAVHRDKCTLAASSSGGVFTAIAEEVLNDGGVVYGCALDQDLRARHRRVDGLDGLASLRGSKYVQSCTGDCYLLAKSDLDLGRRVLYTGCPCQIAGLKSFLGRPYENLIAVDLVCHGVASAAMFDSYLAWLGQRYRGRIVGYTFRDTTVGYGHQGSASFVRGDRIRRRLIHPLADPYYSLYMEGAICRESCYVCEYAGRTREGDITIGDYWGVSRFHPSVETSRGVSLLLLNTPKATRIRESLARSLRLTPSSIESASFENAQLKAPVVRHASREDVLRSFSNRGLDGVAERFYREHRRQVLVARAKNAVPRWARRVFRRLFR